MSNGRVERLSDNAYIVPSYSMQSFTPTYDLHGIMQVVGAVEEKWEDDIEEEEPSGKPITA